MLETKSSIDSRAMILLTRALCVVATAAMIVSFWDGLAMPRLYLAETVATGIIAWGLGRYLHRKAAPRQLFSRAETAAVFAMAAFPLAGEGIARLFGWGLPAEILLVTALRNAMLTLAFLPHVRVAAPAAAVSSLALTAMAFLVLWKWPVAIITGVYCFLGVWWLVAYSWDRLQTYRGEEQPLSVPWRATWMAVAVVALVAVGGALIATRTSAAGTLGELFPSSGGTTWSDSQAWGGVHDGDQAVGATDDAMSFAPVETDLFLESEEPSLYDMFNDTYQEPAKKKKDKKQHRAISLGPMLEEREHVHRSKSETPSREFDSIRERAQTPKAIPAEKKSRAVLHYVGRTPAHLRLETFNHWDGRSLTHQPDADSESLPSLRLEQVGEKPWLAWNATPDPESPDDWRERSGVRVVRLATNRVPTPEGIERLHLKLLDSPDLFAWTECGQLRLNQEAEVPQFTIFECQARLRDFSRFGRSSATPPPEPARLADRIASPAIAELAAAWSEGAVPGWEEVERIVDGVRTTCSHAPDVVVPENAEDAAEHFLFASKQGPDYLFAISTALFLRARGYDVRVASGMYARPENYDRESECTLVLPEDVHFWTEIRTAEGDWVVLEPTPGYERLTPPTSFVRALYEAALVAFDVLRARPITALFLLIGLTLVLVVRRETLALVHCGYWLATSYAAPRKRLIATRKLLHRIGALSDIRRAPSETLRQWLLALSQDWPIEARWDAEEWLALYHAGAYSTRSPASLDRATVERLNRRLIFASLRRTVRDRRDRWAQRLRSVLAHLPRIRPAAVARAANG